MGKYDHIDFRPPEYAIAAYKNGIERHEAGETGDGMEAITVRMARKFARGESCTPEWARKGNRWWGRNARFADEEPGTPAYAAAQLWGGRNWFAPIVRKMDAADVEDGGKGLIMKGHKKIETKTCHGYLVKADNEQGILTHYVSVMGIVDRDNPPDLIELGAFTKTIKESGPAGANKIRTLWQHQWGEVIGHPLEIDEHPREALPAELLSLYPSATGGLYVVTKLNLDVQRGREAFALYRDGDMDEWSIGFDAVRHVKDREILKDQGVIVRRIQEVRLWEVSTVTWGANQATITIAAKSGDSMPPGKIETKAITDEDKQVLVSELAKLNMTDLVATHRRLHQMAAQGNILTGFTQADMDWFNTAIEDELVKRAEDDDRDPPERTPLEWGEKSADEDAEMPEDDDEKHFPGRVGRIAARERRKGLEQTLTSGRYIVVVKGAPADELPQIATRLDNWWADPTKTFCPVGYDVQLIPVLDAPKAVNLSEIVQGAHEAFSTQYNTPNSYRYWVMTVYDEYVIVSYSDETGQSYYQVAYTKTDDGEYQFVPRAEWIEGKFEFVPLESEAPQDETPSAEPPAEQALTPAERLARRLRMSELDLQLTKRR